MGMTVRDSKTSRRVAELTLQNLGLDASSVDRLQTFPYGELNEASQKALSKAGEERGHKGFFGRSALMWAPVMDGDYIPDQPFGSSAPALCKDIPVMVGTTLNEIPMAAFDPKLRESGNWSFDQLKAYFKEKYGAQADALVAAYQKAYPGMKTEHWLYVESFFRPGAIATAQMKADQNGAPAYLYLFSWQSPVMDGRNRSNHCMEIPFVFYNIDMTEQVHGGGAEARALADKVSQAWINFARNGNPNHKGLPSWPAYTRANGATMIFDNTCVVRNHHDKELMSILAPERMN